ncbi:MAG: hypothetical protein EOS85_28305 [Mesorhizobium sp.]|nr:MAG: hypothetical protein EOS85_28305 [Mesorhizobium sp.]
MKRSTNLWENLAGPPVRRSSAIRPDSRDRREHSGFIKLRLGHSEGRTYLIPDVLIGVGGLRFFLPSFFSPPIIAFNVEDGKHIADFSLDVGSPRAVDIARLLVKVRSEDRVLTYEDGAQLYRCSFDGPRRLSGLATGLCHPMPSGDFSLRVYHHTTRANAANIVKSRELWSSPWNLAGTRKLANVAYGYFTSLSKIKNEGDLQLIAMASSEVIKFQTTSNRLKEEVLSLKVYRGDTRDRTFAMGFDVPCEIIAPVHLYFHPSVDTNSAYYEIVGSEIVRVGVNPSAKLHISGSELSAAKADLKRFDYVVLGNAGTLDGLAAPYNEEETKQVTHLEKLDMTTDLFQFWWKNQNTDQVTDRVFEARELSPP